MRKRVISRRHGRNSTQTISAENLIFYIRPCIFTTYGLTTACKMGTVGRSVQFELDIPEEFHHGQKLNVAVAVYRIGSLPAKTKMRALHQKSFAKREKISIEGKKIRPLPQPLSKAYLATLTFRRRAGFGLVKISDEIVLKILAASSTGYGATLARFGRATRNIFVFLGHMVNHGWAWVVHHSRDIFLTKEEEVHYERKHKAPRSTWR